jgi:hypothetical protein
MSSSKDYTKGREKIERPHPPSLNTKCIPFSVQDLVKSEKKGRRQVLYKI